MIRFFLRLLLVPALLSLLVGSGAFAQSSDARLIGTWQGQAGDNKVTITFNADGSAKLGENDRAEDASYTANFAKSPGTLTLTAKGQDGAVLSFIEFVDDNHVRISEPSSRLPASMAEGSPVVFERAPK